MGRRSQGTKRNTHSRPPHRLRCNSEGTAGAPIAGCSLGDATPEHVAIASTHLGRICTVCPGFHAQSIAPSVLRQDLLLARRPQARISRGDRIRTKGAVRAYTNASGRPSPHVHCTFEWEINSEIYCTCEPYSVRHVLGTEVETTVLGNRVC
ncbi:hypothetical protein BKA93DRAFT_390526 [Sparassis latifolia]